MSVCRRSVLAIALLATTGVPTLAQDKVAVGILRFVSSGGLYIAVERGYFKAEKIDIDLKFFEAAQPIAVAVASGDVQFGLTGISGGSLNLAARGAMKIIAGQGGEKKGVVGNTLAVSNDAYARGITSFEKMNGASVAITQVGSTFHYQLGQIAAAKSFPLGAIQMKPLQSVPNMIAAVKTSQVDAAILPPHIVGPMAQRGEVKIIGPLSDVADYQYGALFAASKTVNDNRDLAQRFVRAYVRGLKDYNAALMRKDAQGNRVMDEAALKAGAEIGKYVFASDAPEVAAKKVINAAVYCDPDGKLDVANIEQQVAWYKAEKLVDAGLDAKAILDTRFTQ